MGELLSRHFDTIRWSAEFIMLPLHWMAVAHYYTAATTLGAVVLVTYVVASIKHARLNGLGHKA